MKGVEGDVEKQVTQLFLLAKLFSKETPLRNYLISGFCFPEYIKSRWDSLGNGRDLEDSGKEGMRPLIGELKGAKVKIIQYILYKNLL